MVAGVSTRARISKRTVDAVPKPRTGEARLWDTEVKGFFLRVYPSDRRVYALKYRVGRLQRIFTIGVHGSPLTPEEARDAALDALTAVRAGEDPGAAKKAARDALSVAELIDRYITDGPATKPAKRASTWECDASNLNRHIRPLLGQKIADQVSKSDAARAVRDIGDGRTAAVGKSEKKRGRVVVKGGVGVARRTRITAAAMFSWGIEHGLAKANPFSGVKLTAAPTRERFLSREEAGRLLDTLTSMVTAKELSPIFADAIRLLLLTGARKTEILGLTWSEVSFERSCLVLPPERTKAGGKTGERRIVLSPPALEILSRRNPKGAKPTDFVFPALKGEGHAMGVRRAFGRVLKAAKVEPLRIHDLRHSFASFAIADGASLYLVSKLLGHSASAVTERYAHLSGDPLQDAAAAVGARLMPTEEPPAPEPHVEGEPASVDTRQQPCSNVLDFVKRPA